MTQKPITDHHAETGDGPDWPDNYTREPPTRRHQVDDRADNRRIPAEQEPDDMTTEPAGERPPLALIQGEGQRESAKARQAREVHERFLAKQAEKEEKARQAEARRAEIVARRERLAETNKPRIELDTDPESIRNLAKAIDTGALPDTYVRAGGVVVVETPTGAMTTDDEPAQIITIVEPVKLARLLADHTYTYELVNEKLPDGSTEPIEVEATPKQFVAASALSSTRWDNLPVLDGIVTAPLFRPDGTLVQTPGYDKATRVIYAPILPIEDIPEMPTAEDIEAAKTFLLGKLLADFPWVGPSRANYIGMLVAPLMRHYLGGVLVPAGAVDATSPGTGKSLLTLIMTKIYSGHMRPWVGDDGEIRKAITSILVDKGGAVVVLDNVGKGETVDQPTLAAMLTMAVWSDRILNFSTSVRVPNDRVWMITGNSLTIGGDNASRAVLIRLDAQMPNPEMRPSSKFALGDLEEWLTDPTNRATVLRHLLILVRGWILAGAKRIETPMRTFTPWASATAGFLDWLGETGFMTNRDSLHEVDEEEAQYGAFYACWYALLQDRKMTALELRETTVTGGEYGSNPDYQDWKGTFLVRKKDGAIPSAVGLGKMLAAERGRYRGGYRLNGHYDSDTKLWSYSVTPKDTPIPDGAQ
ncbi:cell envelope integrity protein TolA [Plantactinospora sp. B6F1]|uniref:cell envelope integrity protein TolA n=1 Tax=Plantactinospora sp. B6F1 TaxID=3158971 RepID=UPI0032D8ECE4